MAYPRSITGPAALTVLLMLTIGSGVSAQTPSPSRSPAQGEIAELLTFVPPTARSVGFTDWARIKSSLGAQHVVGASPFEDKVQVVLSTGKGEALASGFGIAHLRDHYDTWAFDAMDLDWEATIQGDGAPSFVLRFRDGFDLASLGALFDARGFSTTSVPGATLRSHEMSIRDSWLTATEFAILNTAFLDDGRTLVLSVDEDQVRDVAARHGQYSDAPALRATAATLEGASAAFFLPGLGTCQGFTPLPFDVGKPLPSLLPSPGIAGLHPYGALAVGYARPDWAPVGRLSFGFPDAAAAAADLPGRVALATTGISAVTREPYADTRFQVTGSHVDDTALTLELAPTNDMPRHLFDMVFARDMTFAGC